MKLSGPTSPFISAIVAGAIGYYVAYDGQTFSSPKVAFWFVIGWVVIGFLVGCGLYWDDRSREKENADSPDKGE